MIIKLTNLNTMFYFEDTSLCVFLEFLKLLTAKIRRDERKVVSYLVASATRNEVCLANARGITTLNRQLVEPVWGQMCVFGSRAINFT